MPAPINLFLKLTGTGSPEGVVPAPVGSTYQRQDGAGLGNPIFYVKQTGYGKTGWASTSSNIIIGTWTEGVMVSNAVYNGVVGQNLGTPPPIPSVLTISANAGKVLLIDSNSLVGGGTIPTYLYNPATNTTATTGSISVGGVTAAVSWGQVKQVVLPSGKVLAPDGVFQQGGVFPPSKSSVYDPTAGTWNTPISSLSNIIPGSLNYHLLSTGKVLAAGGITNFVSGSWLATTNVRLYDPTANSWAFGTAMSAARTQYASVTLPSGNVLVMGGSNAAGGPGSVGINSVERYNPTTGLWTTRANLGLATRFGRAVVLPSGKVLYQGINAGLFGGTFYSAIYDDTANTWTPVNNMPLAKSFSALPPILLQPGGTVLTEGSPVSSAASDNYNLYNPVADTNTVLDVGGMGVILIPVGGTKYLAANGGTFDLSSYPVAPQAVFQGGPGVTWTPAAPGKITAFHMTFTGASANFPQCAIEFSNNGVVFFDEGISNSVNVVTSVSGLNFPFLAGDLIRIRFHYVTPITTFSNIGGSLTLTIRYD